MVRRDCQLRVRASICSTARRAACRPMGSRCPLSGANPTTASGRAIRRASARRRKPARRRPQSSFPSPYLLGLQLAVRWSLETSRARHGRYRAAQQRRSHPLLPWRAGPVAITTRPSRNLRRGGMASRGRRPRNRPRRSPWRRPRMRSSAAGIWCGSGRQCAPASIDFRCRDTPG